MIQIYSYLNSFQAGEEKDKYCFRSVADQTLNSEQLIKEIINYNSTITEADARAVLSVLSTKVNHFVNLGYKVELPFGYIYNKANGTVARINDGFVPGTGNHRISTVFRFKDDAAYEMTKNAAYKNAGSGYVSLPQITELYSIKNNGKEDEALSFAAGSLLRIMGKKISFDIEDTIQGVFLIDSEHHEVHIESYNRIGTNVVEAYIPAVSAGSYEVKIVTKPGTDRYEKCVASKKIEVTA